jgi:hypothetical protein
MAEPRSRNKGEGDKHREQRSGPPELDPDLETTIEDEMMSSGRTSVVPRIAVIGAHPSAVASDDTDLDDEVQMPREGGSDDVAPTAQALERERLRHAQQSALGVLPAGEEGRWRQQRPTQRTDGTGRAALDAAAGEADRRANAARPRPMAGGHDRQNGGRAQQANAGSGKTSDGEDEDGGGARGSGRENWRDDWREDWIERHPRGAVAGAAAAALMLGLGVAIARARN